MSVQFYAKTIMMILNTDSKTDFKSGTIVCQDNDQNWYYYDGPFKDAPIDACKKGAWPNKSKKGIQLYRDYWKSIGKVDSSPRMVNLLAAKKKIIK